MTRRCKLTVDNNLQPHMTAGGNYWTAEACVQMSNNSQNPGKTALAGERTWRIPGRHRFWGPDITFEPKHKNVGQWTSSEAHLAWTIQNVRVETFDVILGWACADQAAGNRFVVQLDGQIVKGKVPGTGGWDNYRQAKFGQFKIKPRESRLTIRPDGPLKGALLDLRGIKLVPAKPDKKK